MARFWLLLLVGLLAACGPALSGAQPLPYATYDPSLPFPIPASCPQLPYQAPAALTAAARGLTPFWIGHDTLAAGHVGAAVWRSGENTVIWWSRGGQPQTELNLLEGKSPPAVVAWQNTGPNLYTSTVTFPQNGCWEVIATTAESRLRFIVYVYPARFVP
ncbi:MAG: hypothetical protein HYR71_07280 [Chloroflexi bacterium]|nr:hypothetical protein [Chloroflexota bacterium]